MPLITELASLLTEYRLSSYNLAYNIVARRSIAGAIPAIRLHTRKEKILQFSTLL